MKNPKNSKKIVVQDNQMSAKSQKHDVNLQKNSSLYFQIGLILCLLATYGLFEMKFEKTAQSFSTWTEDDDPDFYAAVFKIEKVVIEEPQPETPRKVLKLSTVTPIIKDNDFVIKEPSDIVVDDPTPVTIPVATKPTTSNPVKEAPKGPYHIGNVQQVPVYPGCESATTNSERLACMSEKLGKFIQKKFNGDLAAELGLSGVQRIDVQFKIDKMGRVTDIKTRAPYVQLGDEAKRVTNKLPMMTPGQQNGTAVDVVYNLPIVFKVQ